MRKKTFEFTAPMLLAVSDDTIYTIDLIAMGTKQ